MGGKVNYYDYIQSAEWRARANAAKQRAGYRCQVCNRSSNQVTLDAHHRTYERLGNERPDDITVLCRDCHKLYEDGKKLPKPPQPVAPPVSPTPQNKPKDARKGYMAWLVPLLVLVAIFMSSRPWVTGADEDPTSTPIATATRLSTATPSQSSPTASQSTPTSEPTFTPTASQPTPTPEPTFTSTTVAFSRLSFCPEDGFDLQYEKCRSNQDVFSGVVEKLYVSWVPSRQYQGASFLTSWYIDDIRFLDKESTNEYGSLEVATRPSLKPGSYRVEIYVLGKLVQHGSFIISAETTPISVSPTPPQQVSATPTFTPESPTPTSTPIPPTPTATPTLTPPPTSTATPDCDINYAGVCLPRVNYDLDCGDISARRFQSIGSDPHGFDGDNDGIACESN